MPIGLVAKALLGVASKGFTPFSKNIAVQLAVDVHAIGLDQCAGEGQHGKETGHAAVLDLGLAHPLLRRDHAGVLRALDVLVQLAEADRVPGALPGHRIAGLDAARHALERRRGLGLQCRGRGGRRGRHEARGRRDERQARRRLGPSRST